MLVYALSLDAQSATTASLIIVGVTAITAAISYARVRQVDWRAALVFGALGIPASIAGSVLNRAVDPQVLLLAFAALMLLAAAAMYRRSRQSGQPPEARTLTGTAQVARVVLVALGVGFLTGFLGVGGGFLIVPALVLAMGFGMPTAVGTSLIIISPSPAWPPSSSVSATTPSRGTSSSPSRPPRSSGHSSGSGWSTTCPMPR